jgi:hypothetical protein
MAVVVGDNDRGAREYRSVNGLDISHEEREQADKLDISITETLEALKNEFSTGEKSGAREKVSMYWKLGHVLHCLLEEANLVAAEKPYFFLNVKCRAPEMFDAKDRGPKRQHFVYCYRLASYPKDTAELLKWSEWSYLFDSSGINSEPRFDSWFSCALTADKCFFDRTKVRLLGKVLNSFFSRMETADLSDEEIVRCYEAAKSFCQVAAEKGDSSLTKHALEKLKKNRLVLAQVMNGKMPPPALFDSAIKA